MCHPERSRSILMVIILNTATKIGGTTRRPRPIEDYTLGRVFLFKERLCKIELKKF